MKVGGWLGLGVGGRENEAEGGRVAPPTTEPAGPGLAGRTG